MLFALGGATSLCFRTRGTRLGLGVRRTRRPLIRPALAARPRFSLLAVSSRLEAALLAVTSLATITSLAAAVTPATLAASGPLAAFATLRPAPMIAALLDRKSVV